MSNAGTILNVVEMARKKAVSKGDLTFSEFAHAKLGSPVIVYTLAGEPDYWLVPLLYENDACGFAHVDLSGRLIRLGIFGGSPKDRGSWIASDFFYAPPQKFIRDIESNYADAEILSVIFSYDSTPAKWAWTVRVGGRGFDERIIFITPSGWYEKSRGGWMDGREG